MSNEQAPPFLVDAVRASASKMQGLKTALDARAKELDRLAEQLEAERRNLEALASRLESERRSIESERAEVHAARASIDREAGSARDERERLSAEEARLQESAKDLADRERALKEAEAHVERLDREMIGKMRESAAKFLAIVDREEEIAKMQNAWLVAAETREKELRTINEELRARQKESAGLQESLGHLESLFKDETERLAARREELTAKEASLLEAQRYLATILGGNDTGPSEGESRPSSTPTEPPAPPEPSPVPVPIESPSPPEPVEPERRPDTESRPAVTKADAMERLTRAIEAWKRARDGGRNVSELRNPLKLAKEAIQAGQWENAIRLATEVLEALQSPVIAT